MPNALTSAGLETATREELVTYFTEQLQAIYGADINLDSDSPDGQLMNLFIQQVLDLQDLLAEIYNTFDPDNAIGNVLDQRVAINGVQRQAGTYTVTPITVVVTQSVNLYGLDQEDQEVFTVADNEGNEWELEETELGLSIGTHVLNFRAAVPGEQLTVPNTITVPVTIVLGVESVNNPTTYTTLGVNEETDAELKVRRQQSVSLASQGYRQGLLAALLNISGMSSAFVYENTTSVTDSDGVPGHSIWVIVAGTAADADIAQAIYTKRNAGCGMFGEESYIITQSDGSPFEVFWDEVVTRNVFITLTVSPITGTITPNVEAIREGIVEDYSLGVNETADINGLATLVQDIDSNALVTASGFSLADTQILTLSGVAASGTFKINYNGVDSAAINWNDNLATIQSKVVAVTGLEDAVVSGSIASQTLTFDLTALDDILGLITVNTNSLATVAPAAITFSYNEGYTNTLDAPTKQNQLIVSFANVIVLPIVLSPLTSQVETGDDIEFAAVGGYGDYVFSISVNNSGGTIDAATGEYTAGSTPSVSDTVLVTDSMGNTATATVVVA